MPLIIKRVNISLENINKEFFAEVLINQILEKVSLSKNDAGVQIIFKYKPNKAPTTNGLKRFVLLATGLEDPKQATRVDCLRSDEFKLFELVSAT